jgi:hypothetical protein
MHYSQSSPLAEAPDLDMSDPRFDGRDVGQSVSRSSRLRDDWGASYRPSLGKRIFRALTRFLITVLIGVGGTLAWQSDTAREMLVARAPTLAWFLSVSTTNSSAMAATLPVAATSPDPVQALEPLTSNLDAVRRSVEQLADKQNQMAQNIATLQAVEEDIRQKMSSTLPLPSPPQQAAPIAQHKPLQPRAQPLAVQSSVPRSPPPAGPPVELSR